MVTVDALVLGGGLGRRFSEVKNDSELPKQFHVVADQPVFLHSIKALLSLGFIRQVVTVVPAEYFDLTEELIRKFMIPADQKLIRVVVGGQRRQDSSRIGLEAIEQAPSAPSRVLIHDACRPYLSSDLLSRIKDSSFDRSYGAWVPVIPAIETLKKVENHRVIETIDRASVYRVQTPQIFEYSVIRSLVEKTKELHDLNFTDDASLCEYYGIPVGVFKGDVRNLKLTYDFELHTLNSMLSENPRTSGTKDARCEQESVTTFTG